jgi:hypothetical protein
MERLFMNGRRIASVLALCLFGPTALLIAQPPRQLNVDSYQLKTETLTSGQRQDIYLQLIENFVGWTEESKRFVKTDELEPGGGFFDAAGHGVTWARGNSNLCLAYATLLHACPDREQFSIYDIPRERLEHHLRCALRAVCLSNKNCEQHRPAKHTWGGPSWQAALEFIGSAWAAHLCQDQLDDRTLTMVRQVLCREADHLDKQIPSRRQGDTGAEDCCWNAPLLAFAANLCADHPHAAQWETLCKRWAINAASTAADAKSPQIVDQRTLADWTVSENLFPDLTLENHGMWSVGYQCCQQHMGEAELAYRVFDRPAPAALAHHADQMWRDVTSSLFLWDGDILFPHGQDWSWKVYSTIEYLCWQNCCRRNAEAGAIESRALQMVYRRQLALKTGDLGTHVSRLLDFGNQTVKPKRWAFCYLMHNVFGSPPAVPFENAEQAVVGIHRFPFNQVAIHRTAEKCVSVSWHLRFQPVYFLPEGTTTFPDPPFFFPYDRNSGCVELRITSPEVRVTSQYKNPRHPANMLHDGDPSTFWISGRGDSRPGGGPSEEHPEWIQFEFAEPFQARSLLLEAREHYGPKVVELLAYEDSGQAFRPVATFDLDDKRQHNMTFPAVVASTYRIVVRDSYDPRFPESPRNAQIRELAILDTAQNLPKLKGLDLPELLEEPLETDNGVMRVSYRKTFPGGVRQYISVISFPNEATLYVTTFQAMMEGEFSIGPILPLRTSAPPGFDKPVRQFRGVDWLNMSNHVGIRVDRCVAGNDPGRPVPFDRRSTRASGAGGVVRPRGSCGVCETIASTDRCLCPKRGGVAALKHRDRPIASANFRRPSRCCRQLCRDEIPDSAGSALGPRVCLRKDHDRSQRTVFRHRGKR